MSLADQWALLGIAPTDDRRDVKRAYARALKEIDVDEDPGAFIALREALEDALAWGTATPCWEDDDEEDWLDAAGDTAGGEDVAVAADQSGLFAVEWSDHWRPELPAARETPFDTLCAELDGLLFGDGDADPERVAALGAALLADAELENVDRLNGVEQWLIRAIAAAPPRSDPLIEPAAARFGWDRTRRHWRRDHDLEAVLDRRRDLKFLALCRREGHLHHRAFVELTGPPRTRVGLGDLHVARGVSSLLDIVDREHPSLRHDMNRETLDWWRAYFHGRHLPGDFWPIMIIGTLALSLIGTIAIVSGDGEPLLALLSIPVAAALVFGAMALVADLQARLREKAERRWTDGDEARAAGLRFLFAGLALPLIAALLPDAPWSGWAASGCALLLLAAASWNAWGHPTDFWLFPRTRFLPAVAALVSAQMILVLSGPAAARLLPALLALAWIGYLGADAAQDRLRRMDRRYRVATILASLLLAMAAAALLVEDAFPWPPAELALAMVPVAIVAVHLATSASSVDVHVIEWPLRTAALLFYFSSGLFAEEFGQGLLLAFCFYGLAYAALRAGFALHEAWRTRAEGRGALE